MHSYTYWSPRNPPPPPHLDSYKRALLVSQDRRHLFADSLDQWIWNQKDQNGHQERKKQWRTFMLWRAVRRIEKASPGAWPFFMKQCCESASVWCRSLSDFTFWHRSRIRFGSRSESRMQIRIDLDPTPSSMHAGKSEKIYFFSQ